MFLMRRRITCDARSMRARRRGECHEEHASSHAMAKINRVSRLSPFSKSARQIRWRIMLSGCLSARHCKTAKSFIIAACTLFRAPPRTSSTRSTGAIDSMRGKLPSDYSRRSAGNSVLPCTSSLTATTRAHRYGGGFGIGLSAGSRRLCLVQYAQEFLCVVFRKISATNS